jgi:hypothetical protein
MIVIIIIPLLKLKIIIKAQEKWNVYIYNS